MNERHDPSYERDDRQRQREAGREREQDSPERRYRSQEGSREFYPGSYGFDEGSGSAPYTGQGQYGSYGAGIDRYGSGSESERRLPRGEYDPYANRSGRGQWEQFGGERGYSARNDEQDWQRNRYGHSPYGQSPYGQSRYGQSRYSESQFGQHSGEYGPSGQYGQRRDRYRDETYGGDEDRRYQRYSTGGYGEWRPPGQSYGGYGSTGDYGFGSQGLGQERFRHSPGLRYFGTGSYSSGGPGFAGGYGEQRFNAPYDQGGMQGGGIGSGSADYTRSYPRHEEQRPGLLSRIFRRGPKNYQRSDERLREDISERLMRSLEIDSSEVTITVTSGKVTLDGTVPERYMKHSIEDMVDNCPGVQDIDNRIRVETQQRNESASDRWSTQRMDEGNGTRTGNTTSSYGAGSSSGTTGASTPGSASGSSSISGGTSSGASTTRRKDS